MTLLQALRAAWTNGRTTTCEATYRGFRTALGGRGEPLTRDTFDRNDIIQLHVLEGVSPGYCLVENFVFATSASAIEADETYAMLALALPRGGYHCTVRDLALATTAPFGVWWSDRDLPTLIRVSDLAGGVLFPIFMIDVNEHGRVDHCPGFITATKDSLTAYNTAYSVTTDRIQRPVGAPILQDVPHAWVDAWLATRPNITEKTLIRHWHSAGRPPPLPEKTLSKMAAADERREGAAKRRAFARVYRQVRKDGALNLPERVNPPAKKAVGKPKPPPVVAEEEHKETEEAPTAPTPAPARDPPADWESLAEPVAPPVPTSWDVYHKMVEAMPPAEYHRQLLAGVGAAGWRLQQAAAKAPRQKLPPDVRTAEPVPFDIPEQKLQAAVRLDNHLQFSEADEDVRLKLRLKGSFFSGLQVYGSRKMLYPVKLRESKGVRDLSAGHRTDAKSRDLTHAVAGLVALAHAASANVPVYEIGASVAKMLGYEGHCYSHACSPSIDEADVARHRSSTSPTRLPFEPDYCENRCQDCPVLRGAVESPDHLVILLREVSYYSDAIAFVKRALASRKAKGYSTRVIEAFKTYAGLPQTGSIEYPEEFVEILPDGTMLATARGNLSSYRHTPYVPNWFPHGYERVASIGRSVVGVVRSGEWHRRTGRAPKPVTGSSSLPWRRHVNPVGSPVSGSFKAKLREHVVSLPLPAPLSIASVSEATPSLPDTEVEGAPPPRTVSYRRPPVHTGWTACYDVFLDFEQFRGLSFQDTDMIWAGSAGVFVGTGACDRAGTSQVGIPALLGSKILTTLVNRLKPTSGPYDEKMAPYISNAIRAMPLSEVQKCALQPAAMAWHSIVSRHLQLWRERQGYAEGIAFVWPTLATKRATTPWYDIGRHAQNGLAAVGAALSVGLPRGRSGPRPKLLFGPCLWEEGYKLPAPDNLLRAENRAAANEQAKEYLESTKGRTVFAILIERESSLLEGRACGAFKRPTVSRVGPCFQTRPACPQLCASNALYGFLGRQLGNPSRLQATDEVLTVCDTLWADYEALFFEPPYAPYSLVEKGCGYPRQGVMTPEQWADQYKGAPQVAAQLVAELRLIKMGQRVRSDVEAFVKSEFQGVYAPGATAPDLKVPRIISNRHQSNKATCLGITATLSKLLAATFPQMGVYDSPDSLALQLSAFLTTHDLPGYSAGGFDISRMDGHMCPALKSQLVSFVIKLTNRVVADLGDPHTQEQANLFISALQDTERCIYRVGDSRRGVFNAFGQSWVFLLVGSNCSGDFATTIYNTLASIFMHRRVMTNLGYSYDDWFIKVTGDDGLVVGPRALMGAYKDEFVSVAGSIGFTATAEIGPLMGDGPRASYCSRHIYAWYGPSGEVVVATPRLFGKAITNFGDTVKHVNDHASYMRAKCLSELTWARGWPVVQALVLGTLACPTVAAAKRLEFDRDTAYKLVPTLAQDLNQEQLYDAARLAASKMTTTWLEPTLECRAEFEAHTGISPDTQLQMEHLLRERGRQLGDLYDAELGQLLQLR